MIKDIIVNLRATKNDSAVANYAASVAAVLQAHLTASRLYMIQYCLSLMAVTFLPK